MCLHECEVSVFVIIMRDMLQGRFKCTRVSTEDCGCCVSVGPDEGGTPGVAVPVVNMSSLLHYFLSHKYASEMVSM